MDQRSDFFFHFLESRSRFFFCVCMFTKAILHTTSVSLWVSRRPPRRWPAPVHRSALRHQCRLRHRQTPAFHRLLHPVSVSTNVAPLPQLFSCVSAFWLHQLLPNGNLLVFSNTSWLVATYFHLLWLQQVREIVREIKMPSDMPPPPSKGFNLVFRPFSLILIHFQDAFFL